MLSMLKALHRDNKAQAMVEAAILMPLITLVFLAAHEFQILHDYKHRTIWATRYYVWETIERLNHVPNDPGEISRSARNTVIFAARTEIENIFFEGQLMGYEGNQIWVPEPTVSGEFGFMNSFSFSDIPAGDQQQASSGNGQGQSTGGFDFASLAGNLITGGNIGGIPFGSDLPDRGYFFGGFSPRYTPNFHALLAPGQGTTRYAFYGSNEAQVKFDDDTTAESGTAGQIQLGLTTGRKPPYGQMAMFTHDWRMQDDNDLNYHVAGWTLFGSLTSVIEAWDGGGAFSSIVSAVLPFRCCTWERKVGAPYEHAQALNADFD